MTNFISNAFSLNMLTISSGLRVHIQPVSSQDIPLDGKSIIGHEDVAKILSQIIHRDVPVNRESVILNDEDILYVVQYRGPRLPAGATLLPEGASLEFYRITFWR